MQNRGFKDDPDDDKFIECAVALKAEVIVSGDEAVKEIGGLRGVMKGIGALRAAKQGGELI